MAKVTGMTPPQSDGRVTILCQREGTVPWTGLNYSPLIERNSTESQARNCS